MKLAAVFLAGFIAANVAWLAYYRFSPPPRSS